MSILHKNARNVRFVSFRKNSIYRVTKFLDDLLMVLTPHTTLLPEWYSTNPPLPMQWLIGTVVIGMPWNVNIKLFYVHVFSCVTRLLKVPDVYVDLTNVNVPNLIQIAIDHSSVSEIIFRHTSYVSQKIVVCGSNNVHISHQCESYKEKMVQK